MGVPVGSRQPDRELPALAAGNPVLVALGAVVMVPWQQIVRCALTALALAVALA